MLLKIDEIFLSLSSMKSSLVRLKWNFNLKEQRIFRKSKKLTEARPNAIKIEKNFQSRNSSLVRLKRSLTLKEQRVFKKYKN